MREVCHCLFYKIMLLLPCQGQRHIWTDNGSQDVIGWLLLAALVSIRKFFLKWKSFWCFNLSCVCAGILFDLLNITKIDITVYTLYFAVNMTNENGPILENLWRYESNCKKRIRGWKVLKEQQKNTQFWLKSVFMNVKIYLKFYSISSSNGDRCQMESFVLLPNIIFKTSSARIICFKVKLQLFSTKCGLLDKECLDLLGEGKYEIFF